MRISDWSSDVCSSDLFCSTRTLSALPPPGEAARLEIVTHVREDHIHLYGFGGAREREWFRLLTTVQGVGARVALAILSVLGPDDLAQAIAVQDRHAVARSNGVGSKRSEERRGGKESVSTVSVRWSPSHSKK